MESNQRMVDWSAQWTLIDGSVLCVRCNRSQMISNAAERFPHDPACEVKSRVCEHPWADLHEILDRERG